MTFYIGNSINTVIRLKFNCFSDKTLQFVIRNTCPRESKPSIWLRSSINVRWISLSAEVPSENLRPPIKGVCSLNDLNLFPWLFLIEIKLCNWLLSFIQSYANGELSLKIEWSLESNNCLLEYQKKLYTSDIKKELLI